MWFRPSISNRKVIHSQKTINAAIKADMNARRYVLIEELQKATSREDLMDLIDQLNTIDIRMECFENRSQLKTNRFVKDSLVHEWNRASKQVSTCH